MEQLLQSIKRVNSAKQLSNRNFESHIFFDNGVCDNRLTDFALQLISVAKKTLGKICYSKISQNKERLPLKYLLETGYLSKIFIGLPQRLSTLMH